jgi:hypothetical protein
VIDLLTATPFDWFGFLSGASQRLSSCFRLPKMLYYHNSFKISREGLVTFKHVSSSSRMMMIILMILHMLTCVFFLLGNDGPTDIFTWYRHPADDAEFHGLTAKDYDYTGRNSQKCAKSSIHIVMFLEN